MENGRLRWENGTRITRMLRINAGKKLKEESVNIRLIRVIRVLLSVVN